MPIILPVRGIISQWLFRSHKFFLQDFWKAGISKRSFQVGESLLRIIGSPVFALVKAPLLGPFLLFKHTKQHLVFVPMASLKYSLWAVYLLQYRVETGI